MTLFDKNLPHLEQFREKLLSEITTYLQQHNNRVEIEVQGSISSDGTQDDDDVCYISYVYTAIAFKDNDVIAEGYSFSLGDDERPPCSVCSEFLSADELLNIMFCLN